MKRPIMYTRELRKYKEYGTASDSRGKVVNAPVLHISSKTIKNLPSLCRKETDDTSNTCNPKLNITNGSGAITH